MTRHELMSPALIHTRLISGVVRMSDEGGFAPFTALSSFACLLSRAEFDAKVAEI